MADVVTFGELMLRLTPPGVQRLAQAPHLEINFGGAEANVAVVVAQLGGSAEFVPRLPSNAVAQRAINELRGLGVAPSGLSYDAGVEATLDALAAHLETHLDVDGILALAR